METEEFIPRDYKENAFKALYETILGRQASSAEIANWVSQYSTMGVEDLVNLMYAFSNSIEAQNARKQHGRFGDVLGQSREPDEVEPVRAIISLGDHCFTSNALKIAELRRFSGPFDWIFSSPEMVSIV